MPGVGELFRSFNKVSLSGFGGVLPFVRRMLVEEKRWMTAQEFNAQLGLCQFLPGPNVINLSVLVGARFHGWRGALAASGGMLLAPFLIVLCLAFAYGTWGHLPVVQAVLRGVAAAGAGLLIATAIKMARSVDDPWVYLPFAGVILVGVAVFRWPLPVLMVVLLAASAGLAYWRLLRRQRTARSNDDAAD